MDYVLQEHGQWQNCLAWLSWSYDWQIVTQLVLVYLVHQNDWFTSVDLKDAYFHIPYIPHQKFLWLTLQGVYYEYHVLPFSLFLSLRVFVCFTLHSAEVAGHSLSHVPG